MHDSYAGASEQILVMQKEFLFLLVVVNQYLI